MCILKQLFYDKNIIFKRKKTTEKPWQNILHNAGLTLNDLYDTTCMIQLVKLYKIVNSYKFDVEFEK